LKRRIRGRDGGFTGGHPCRPAFLAVPGLLLALMASLAADPAPPQSPAQPDQKQAFVLAMSQFTEAIAGAYGDERARVWSAIASMRKALGEWDDAIRAHEAAVAAQPPSAELRMTLGAVYLDRSRVADALREFAVAIRLEPDRSDVYSLQGLADARAGEPGEAAQAFARGSSLDPDNPATFYTLAQHLLKTGRPDEAKKAQRSFQESERRRLAEPPGTPTIGPPFKRVSLVRQPSGVAPIFPPALYSRGFALLSEGRYDEAIASFAESAEGDPLSTNRVVQQDRMAQGSAALRQGKLESALGHFRAAVVLDPDNAEAHRLLGIAYRMGDEDEDSIEQFKSAIRLNPHDERSRVALADVLVSQGRDAEAEREFKASIEALPGSGQSHYNLGRLLQSSWRPSEALRQFEEAVACNPLVGLDYLYQTIIGLQLAQSNVDGAIDTYTNRIIVNPNDADTHRKLGELYLQEGLDDEALTELLAALLINPRDSRAFAGMGQVHLRNGSYGDAAEAAQRALDIDSTSKDARFVLGSALMRLGDAEEGSRQLQEFQRLQTVASAAQARSLELKMLMQEASASLEKKEYDLAITRLQKALAYESTATTYLNLGVVLMKAGRHPEALEAFEKAHDLKDGPEIHRHLSQVYQALDRPEESQKEGDLYQRLKEEQLRKAGAPR
jgi:tetratricopeptide (TPR) repeat protein